MKKGIVIIIALITVLSACKRWTETDLTEETVVLLAPANNHSDSLLSTTFFWEELKGTDEYKLQVVSPSFDSMIYLDLDSVMTVNSFVMNLLPGSYQWRVKAMNSISETEYSMSSFVITETESLNGQIIDLVSPSSQWVGQDSSLFFDWSTLGAADEYIFKIVDSGNGTVVYTESTTEDSLTYVMETDGNYRWTVQAINAIGATAASERYFTLDRVQPNAPFLLIPSELDTISQLDIDFTWTQASDNGSALTDSLYIGTDSLFSTVYSYKGISESYSADSLPSGTYLWKVQSFDAAGNVGIESQIRTIVLE
jgi:hypothetical protein